MHLSKRDDLSEIFTRFFSERNESYHRFIHFDSFDLFDSFARFRMNSYHMNRIIRIHII